MKCFLSTKKLNLLNCLPVFSSMLKVLKMSVFPSKPWFRIGWNLLPHVVVSKVLKYDPMATMNCRSANSSTNNKNGYSMRFWNGSGLVTDMLDRESHNWHSLKHFWSFDFAVSKIRQVVQTNIHPQHYMRSIHIHLVTFVKWDIFAQVWHQAISQ